MSYRVLGKYINGAEITGYRLVDEADKSLKVKVSDFIAMVRNGLVEDFKYMDIDGHGYAVPRNGLVSQMQVLNNQQFKIKGRVFDNSGQVIGYEVISDTGKELKLSKSKVWELAFENMISNVTASYSESNGNIKRLIIIED